jgi:hypothetical protein
VPAPAERALTASDFIRAELGRFSSERRSTKLRTPPKAPITRRCACQTGTSAGGSRAYRDVHAVAMATPTVTHENTTRTPAAPAAALFDDVGERSRQFTTGQSPCSTRSAMSTAAIPRRKRRDWPMPSVAADMMKTDQNILRGRAGRRSD